MTWHPYVLDGMANFGDYFNNMVILYGRTVMKLWFVSLFAMVMVLSGAEQWKAIVTPGANVYLCFGEKAMSVQAESAGEEEERLEKLQELIGEERKAGYKELGRVTKVIDAVPGFRKGLKSVRICDSFSGKMATAIAYEFKATFSLDEIEKASSGKLKVTKGKAGALDMLSIESAVPFALVSSADGRFMFLVQKKEAGALAARIAGGKYCDFTAEMKYLMQYIGKYAGGCLEITNDMRRKINEKASLAMAEEPVKAMMLMKFAEMKGVVADVVKNGDAYTLTLGFSNMSPLVASGVKEQLFDGMMIPMAQAMAQGAAPGNTQIANMFSSYVKDRAAFLKVQMKEAEIKAIRDAM